jgi:hypothetical protein
MRLKMWLVVGLVVVLVGVAGYYLYDANLQKTQVTVDWKFDVAEQLELIDEEDATFSILFYKSTAVDETHLVATVPLPITDSILSVSGLIGDDTLIQLLWVGSGETMDVECIGVNHIQAGDSIKLNLDEMICTWEIV